MNQQATVSTSVLPLCGAMAWRNASQALNLALITDRIDEVRRLIASGVDVNRQDSSGRRPLDYTTVLDPCYESSDGEHDLRLQKAQLLLASGADPNLRDAGGWSLVHQCAHVGDLALLRTIVRKGARVGVCNNRGHLPVEQAFHRGHTLVVRYQQQSCDLRSLCRCAIRDAMGKRSNRRLNELPLPSGVKLFLNYGTPFQGFSATMVPSSPWTPGDLHSGRVEAGEVERFMQEHASEVFLEQHGAVLRGMDMTALAEAFQSMYLWESFKRVSYEEPAARPPRYSLEKREDREGEEGTT